PRCRSQRVLTADRDQAVDPRLLEVAGEPLGSALLGEGVGSRRAEDRAPARKDPPHLGYSQRSAVALERAAPAVPVAEELVAVDPDPLPHDRADHRVEAGAVAAAGEDSDSHRLSLGGSEKVVAERPQQ